MGVDQPPMARTSAQPACPSRCRISGANHEPSRNSKALRVPAAGGPGSRPGAAGRRPCRAATGRGRVPGAARVPRGVIEAGQRFFRPIEALVVGQVAAGLHGEGEAVVVPGLLRPGAEVVRRGQAIEAAVRSRRWEVAGIVAEPGPLRQVGRIEAADPMPIDPARCADPDHNSPRQALLRAALRLCISCAAYAVPRRPLSARGAAWSDDP